MRRSRILLPSSGAMFQLERLHAVIAVEQRNVPQYNTFTAVRVSWLVDISCRFTSAVVPWFSGCCCCCCCCWGSGGGGGGSRAILGVFFTIFFFRPRASPRLDWHATFKWKSMWCRWGRIKRILRTDAVNQKRCSCAFFYNEVQHTIDRARCATQLGTRLNRVYSRLFKCRVIAWRHSTELYVPGVCWVRVVSIPVFWWNRWRRVHGPYWSPFHVPPCPIPIAWTQLNDHVASSARYCMHSLYGSRFFGSCSDYLATRIRSRHMFECDVSNTDNKGADCSEVTSTAFVGNVNGISFGFRSQTADTVARGGASLARWKRRSWRAVERRTTSKCHRRKPLYRAPQGNG